MTSFWPKQYWPPRSPDLNPMDYSIWAELEKVVCAKPHKNLENLKKQLKRAWKKIDPEYIRATCNSAEARFEAVRKAAGGHIK